ncbi:MAG: dTDP-4-dehydrorhamnose reductase [Phycisphaerae bacterium]
MRGGFRWKQGSVGVECCGLLLDRVTMKIAVIGTSGQLGFDLQRILPGRGHEVASFSGRAELDITDAAAVGGMLDARKPEAVINTAAFHNVDLCEKETDAAYRTNVVAVREMAKACEARGVLFVQIGTDYVVGGGEGWPEGKPVPESAAVHPNSIYSLTRFGGDCMTLAHAQNFGYVVRSWVLFGIAGCKLKGGLNFVDTMVKAAREGKHLRVVDDQTVAPTPTDDLSVQLAVMLEAGKEKCPPGLYHAVSHGEVTWYAFAKRGLELAGVKHTIEPVASSVYAAPAKRPRYSVLDNAKLRGLGLDRMRSWEEGLERFVKAKYLR